MPSALSDKSLSPGYRYRLLHRLIEFETAFVYHSHMRHKLRSFQLLKDMHQIWCSFMFGGMLLIYCQSDVRAYDQANAISREQTVIHELHAEYGRGNNTTELRGPIFNDPKCLRIDASLVRGSFILKAGSVLPLILLTPLNANQIRVGQPVRGVLLKNISASSISMIPEGSEINGWICEVQRNRSVMASKLSLQHWSDPQAMINTLCFASAS